MAFPAKRGNWYVVSHVAGATNRDVQSGGGSWSSPGGTIAADFPGIASGVTTLSFELYSDTYFTAGNQGHLAIATGARSDQGGLEGRGIVLGNVTGLAADQRTSKNNTICMETFYLNGNRVFGRETEGFSLQNGVSYGVRIEANPVNKTMKYRIHNQSTGAVMEREITDSYGLSPWYKGFFLAEVFGNHAWSLQYNDVIWS